MLVYLTIDGNEKSFVNGTPTWRRWRHVQTKNKYSRLLVYLYIYYIFVYYEGTTIMHPLVALGAINNVFLLKRIKSHWISMRFNLIPFRSSLFFRCLYRISHPRCSKYFQTHHISHTRGMVRAKPTAHMDTNMRRCTASLFMAWHSKGILGDCHRCKPGNGSCVFADLCDYWHRFSKWLELSQEATGHIFVLFFRLVIMGISNSWTSYWL
jgi:hypothetical protein